MTARFSLSSIAAALLAAALTLAPGPAAAVNPNEMLKDPLLEKRAREISKVLRCLVCQNQSIDDSDADLARDLRVIVRQRLTTGDSDGEVIDYVVARYGDFVLLKPPFKGATLVLWIGPALIALGGLAAMIAYLRRNRRSAAAGGAAKATPLTADEQRRLAKLMKDGAPWAD
jgi:cytochrome c-type biogenesis protein CcmH